MNTGFNFFIWDSLREDLEVQNQAIKLICVPTLPLVASAGCTRDWALPVGAHAAHCPPLWTAEDDWLFADDCQSPAVEVLEEIGPHMMFLLDGLNGAKSRGSI